MSDNKGTENLNIKIYLISYILTSVVIEAIS